MHEYRIQIILAVLLVFLLYKLLRSVLKKKLEIKYVLSWIIVDFCLLIIDLFPSILTFLCKCLGIQLASNMIFLVAIILLFLLALSHTILLSKLVESIHHRLHIFRKFRFVGLQSFDQYSGTNRLIAFFVYNILQVRNIVMNITAL